MAGAPRLPEYAAPSVAEDPRRIVMADASTPAHPGPPPPQERAWRYRIKEDLGPADLSGELNTPATQERGTGQTSRLADGARR